MYIPDELKKVNKFVDVAIPSNRSYFSRIGEVQLSPSQFTGDEVAPMNLSKIEQISDYEQYVAMKAHEQESKND